MGGDDAVGADDVLSAGEASVTESAEPVVSWPLRKADDESPSTDGLLAPGAEDGDEPIAGAPVPDVTVGVPLDAAWTSTRRTARSAA